MIEGVKVKDYPDLIRPTGSGGVVNVNREEYERALARTQRARREKNLEARVSGLEEKLDTILKILQKE